MDSRCSHHLIWLATVAVLACAGCSGQTTSPATPVVASSGSPAELRLGASTRPRGFGASGKIQHVVVVIQENRSFDNLFQGYPGADTSSTGEISTKATIPLQPIPLEAPLTIGHNVTDFLTSYNKGKMNGFNRELYSPHNSPYGNYPMYGYVPASESAPYFALAQQYVLGDNNFASNIDDSFQSHQYAIAAQAGGSANVPDGSWGCLVSGSTVATLKQNRTLGPSESACFDYQTLGDELDGVGLPWSYYAVKVKVGGQLAGIWSAYQAVNHIYNGPDWKNVISPQTKFLTDVQGGKLSAVTWITPTCTTSDHSDNFGCRGSAGPNWVTSIVNAVGASNFWSSTVIFVVWDEWGGWYDHVPPPYKDYDGLGMRVPLLVISPYAKAGYVSHTQYEMASIDRFIEDNFGLAQLSAADARATDPAADCLNFAQKPRLFVPFPSKMAARDLSSATADNRNPDPE